MPRKKPTKLPNAAAFKKAKLISFRPSLSLPDLISDLDYLGFLNNTSLNKEIETALANHVIRNNQKLKSKPDGFTRKKAK